MLDEFSVLKAIESVRPPPCDRFACEHKTTCAEGYACLDFAHYVKTGESRRMGGAEPSKMIYEMVFLDQDIGQLEEKKVKEKVEKPENWLKIKVVCANCQKAFWVAESEVKRGKGRYCSLSCAAATAAKNRKPKGARTDFANKDTVQLGEKKRLKKDCKGQ